LRAFTRDFDGKRKVFVMKVGLVVVLAAVRVVGVSGVENTSGARRWLVGGLSTAVES
jgi:hypothetical protein